MGPKDLCCKSHRYTLNIFNNSLFKDSVKHHSMIYRLHNKSSCIVLLLAKITPSGSAADVGLQNLCCEFESFCPCQAKAACRMSTGCFHVPRRRLMSLYDSFSKENGPTRHRDMFPLSLTVSLFYCLVWREHITEAPCFHCYSNKHPPQMQEYRISREGPSLLSRGHWPFTDRND